MAKSKEIPMDRDDVGRQVMVEHETLKHLTNALHSILDWRVSGDDFTRKLSSLRFCAESFQRHLARLFALEEYEGYMDVVLEERPNLANEIEALRTEHDQFRRTLHRMVSRLDRLSSQEREVFDGLCSQLRELLKRLDEHHRKETALLQEALLQDEGGPG
jgi:hemerythrin-like domain-containing protein